MIGEERIPARGLECDTVEYGKFCRREKALGERLCAPARMQMIRHKLVAAQKTQVAPTHTHRGLQPGQDKGKIGGWAQRHGHHTARRQGKMLSHRHNCCFAGYLFQEVKATGLF